MAFAAIYFIWGSTYLGIKYAIETIPPFLMAGIRNFSPGLFLFIVLKLRGEPSPERSHWRDASIIGALLLLGGNGLVTWAESYVPSGLAALLVATVPLWMSVINGFYGDKLMPTRR
ncbi:MAG TPA: EamA family transporter, partial [bacterium]|nr:EamA family transporter [bacterium]